VNSLEGTLKLVRSFTGQFADGTCGGMKPCASGCFCHAGIHEARKYVGCTCTHAGIPTGGVFYCDSQSSLLRAQGSTWTAEE